MPSKLKKALAAVKDQTSIGLAKVSSSICSNLDVALLKATTHEEVPIDDRYVTEVILLTSSSKAYSTACVRALARRITRTHNWVVALKSLTLTLNLLQCPGPAFAQEIVDAMNYGVKLLDLSGFRDTSTSNPWDYTAFVRTFALYLNERLNCTMEESLKEMMNKNERRRSRESLELAGSVKPAAMLGKVFAWQRLLERAVATRPTGPARNSRLVQISLYSIVRETFNLYRDISEGLAFLLHSFLQLPHPACLDVVDSFTKAAKQFDELDAFYALCRSMGVGRMSDYPNVQKISQDTLNTLMNFMNGNSAKPSSSPQIQDSPMAVPPAKKQNQEARRTEEKSLSSQKIQVKREQQGERSTNSDETSAKCMIEKLKRQGKQLNSYSSGSKRVDYVGWELALLECASNISKEINHSKTTGFDSSRTNDLNDQSLTYKNHDLLHNYNPFLHVGNESSNMAQQMVSTLPALPPLPTFVAQKNETECNQLVNHARGSDPFATGFAQAPDMATKQKLVQEQQLWMHNQSKILMRHIVL